MIELALSVLRVAWPFVLAAAIWGVQEVRIGTLHLQLNASHKRETVLQSNLDVAHQRATDLALLYAGTLDKPEQARKAQEEEDRVQIATLQQRIDGLSRAPTVHFSGLAVGLLDDLSAFANGGHAPAAGDAAARQAVPDAAYSEADLVSLTRDAADAYRDAVTKLNTCVATYDAARAAQLKVNQ